MLSQTILDRFVSKCPGVLLVVATFEHLFQPQRLDRIFVETAKRQYHRDLLFSELVAVMNAVATRTHQSVHSAYQAHKKRLGVSSAALYAKLNHMEPQISSQIVRQTAIDARAVIEAMPGGSLKILDGLRVYYLDGNHLACTEHRPKVTRVTREGVLPGQSLALLDAQTGLVDQLILCEDGHSQERSMLPQLLTLIDAGMTICADRNFCTSMFLFGLADRGATFVIRQHASTLTYEEPTGKRRRIGRSKTGMMYEQTLELTHMGCNMSVRRITVELDKPTGSGDQQIHILTNLKQEQATAVQVAEVYQTRWTIEGAFQQMTDVLCCEVRTLGYPKAALFAFAVAVLAYNTYAVVKAALRAAHGEKKIADEFSDYHLVNEVSQTYVGMRLIVEPQEWERYHGLNAIRMALQLIKLAEKIDLKRYPKKKRGPKKPRPANRKSGAKNHHVSTARLLKAEKAKKRKIDTP